MSGRVVVTRINDALDRANPKIEASEIGLARLDRILRAPRPDHEGPDQA